MEYQGNSSFKFWNQFLYPYSSKQYSINSIDLLRVLLFLFSRSKHSFKTRIDSFKNDCSLFFKSLTWFIKINFLIPIRENMIIEIVKVGVLTLFVKLLFTNILIYLLFKTLENFNRI